MASGAYVILKDLGLKDLRRKMQEAAKGLGVKAGIQEGSKRSGDDLTNAELAIVHEYGTSSIPARPFIGPTAEKKQESWYKLLGGLTKKVDFTNPNIDDIKDALDAVGMRMASDIKQTIRNGLSPALKPATIARKGSSKPLIDSGQLVNSITHKVTKE